MSGDRNYHPGADGSMDLGFAPDPVREAPQATGSSVTLSQEQFDALLARLGPSEPAYDYASVLGPEVGAAAAPQPPEPQPDPIVGLIQNLPNPQADFEGFKRSLGQVLADGRQQILQEAQGSAGTVAEINRGYDDAWADFQTRYGELASRTKLISMATREEFAELQRRGYDPRLVMAQNTEGFVDAVAARVSSVVAEEHGYAGDENPEDFNRTDMIGGGQPGPSRPGRQSRQDNAPTSLVDDIKKLQREMGIY